MSYTEHGHTFSLSERSPDWWRGLEREHTDLVAQLGHLVDVVREHRSYDECPIYCWGEHFTGDLTVMTRIQGLEVISHLLYLACAKLAGAEID